MTLLFLGWLACAPGLEAPAVDSVATASIGTPDAAQIAGSFVEAMAQRGVLAWRGAELGPAVPLTDFAGEVLALEFPVWQGEEAAGWVRVPVRAGMGAVSAYSAEGEARTALVGAALFERVGAEVGPLRFLVEPAQRIAVIWEGGESEHAELVNLGEGVAYAPTLEGASPTQLAETFAASAQGEPVDLVEEEALRAALMDGGEGLLDWFDGAPVGVGQGVAVGSGAASFPNWSQPWSVWTTGGTCSLGCTPLAAMVALEYWDNNGYGSAVGWGSPTTTGSGAYWDADTMRAAMGTTCSGSVGITSPGLGIGSGIWAYLQGKGYNWSVVDNTPGQDGKSLWERIMTQVGRGRPILLHWSGSPGHSVVVYEYTDNASNTNDWICYKPGDGSSYACMNRSGNSWIQTTRMVP